MKFIINIFLAGPDEQSGVIEHIIMAVYSIFQLIINSSYLATNIIMMVKINRVGYLSNSKLEIILISFFHPLSLDVEYNVSQLDNFCTLVMGIDPLDGP